MRALLNRGLMISVVAIATHGFAATRYVDLNNPNPAPPYSSWSTAATNIQDAVDLAAAGDIVRVADGVYQSGSRTNDGAMNRVFVTNAITLESVNGAEATIIDGGRSVRCIWMADGVLVNGFTVRNGKGGDGAGIKCASTNAFIVNSKVLNNYGITGGGVCFGTISNCTIFGNTASNNFTCGGGAYGSVLYDSMISSNAAIYHTSGTGNGGGILSSAATRCTLLGNGISGYTADGGGAAYSSLTNCLLDGNVAVDGGGGYNCTLVNCVVSNNAATEGGGAYHSDAYNCLFFRNWAYGGGGGGCAETRAFNCTIVRNQTTGTGGGIYAYLGGSAFNSIIYSNWAALDGPSNYAGAITMQNCCTEPLPAGSGGNISSPPLFINVSASDFRLQTNSPCIEAGSNGYGFISPDLGGNPRLVGNVLDIGVYEFQAPTYFSLQPQSQTNYADYPTVFNSLGVGPLPFTYQWQFNGVDIPGATNATFEIASSQSSDAGSYRVVISNAVVSARSSNATLTVLSSPPTILSSPLSLVTNLGASAAFNVSVFSPYPVGYQWQHNGTNISDSGRVSGTTSSNLLISALKFDDAGSYDVIVTNKFGAVTSSAPSLTILGPANRALRFSGGGSVSIAATDSLSGTFTVECWVNPAVWGVLGVMGSRHPSDQSFDFKLYGSLHGDIGDGSSWITTSADASFNYTPGNWYHLAYVVTPTNYTVYTNGQTCGSGNYSQSVPLLYDANHQLTIGNTGTGERMIGIIDEVRIWATARSQSEIQSNIYTELSGSEPGLRGYWRFNEGLSSTSADASGHGLTATLSGDATWVLSSVAPPSPTFAATRMTANGFQISFATLANFTYVVQSVDCLGCTNQWTAIATVPGTGDANPITITDPASSPSRFYRLLRQPPQ